MSQTLSLHLFMKNMPMKRSGATSICSRWQILVSRQVGPCRRTSFENGKWPATEKALKLLDNKVQSSPFTGEEGAQGLQPDFQLKSILLLFSGYICLWLCLADMLCINIIFKLITPQKLRHKK